MTDLPSARGRAALSLAPVESRGSLAEADERAWSRWRRARSARRLDVFGRMRTEMFIGRVSDGIPHVFEGRLARSRGGAARRVGGAALEYRLIHLDWPRAGDRLELRSGAGRRRRALPAADPLAARSGDSGRPWGVAEAIAVSFDLETPAR